MNVKFFYFWLILAAAVTGVVGTAYTLAQQTLRQTANDPQIQMAEDGARLLASGQDSESILPSTPPIDLAVSLAPFVIVYNDSGSVIASSGQLDGKTPVPPAGVFDFVKTHAEERVTWQPRPDVRIASVTTRFTGSKSGFVLAGRSLRETEERVSMLTRLAAFGWAAILGSTFLMTFIPLAFIKRKEPSSQ